MHGLFILAILTGAQAKLKISKQFLHLRLLFKDYEILGANFEIQK